MKEINQVLPLIVIHGPTASGKSALALYLAKQLNGEIVNGDSLQVYDQLKVLTARPTDQDTQEIPHHLYGILGKDQNASVAWWYEAAGRCIQTIHARHRLPIVVGGTGLYLKTLTHGLSAIPAISSQVRSHVRSLADRPDFFTLVKEHDPEIADVLRPEDRQRLARALEVKFQTGHSIRFWQKQSIKLFDFSVCSLALIPDRTALYDRINQRVLAMVNQGALEEVEAIIKAGLEPDCSLLKAIGVFEFGQFLREEWPLDRAVEKTQQLTRNYAKRQLTWLRNQTDVDYILTEGSLSERKATLEKLLTFLARPYHKHENQKTI